MLKKSLIIIALVILFPFLFKDLILKTCITNYIEETFEGDCTIRRASMSLKQLRIDNLRFVNKGLNLLLEGGSVNFYFAHVLKPEVSRIDISDCNIRFRGVEANSLNLKKDQADLYTLKIPRIRIRGEEIRNILNLDKVSFRNVLAVISDDVILGGLFEGRVSVCLEGGKVSQIEGNFYNDEGGIVNIEKEVSLNFLRKHLDESSHQALIDSFKDYTYNKGVIKLSKKDGGLLLCINFSSDEMGERNITINFHDILD